MQATILRPITKLMDAISPAHRFVQRNADRLFAGFSFSGSMLLTKAGNYADNNGDAHNKLLMTAGLIEIATELYQFVRGDKSKPGPGYMLSAGAIMASGVGVFGLSNGSLGELGTGTLQELATVCTFYLDKPKVGAFLYDAACVPFLEAGIQHHNPFEWGTALLFILANRSIACKPKTQPVALVT